MGLNAFVASNNFFAYLLLKELNFFSFFLHGYEMDFYISLSKGFSLMSYDIHRVQKYAIVNVISNLKVRTSLV